MARSPRRQSLRTALHLMAVVMRQTVNSSSSSAHPSLMSCSPALSIMTCSP